MASLLQPLHVLLMMFAGWVNRHQLDVIEYLQEENRVLKERLGNGFLSVEVCTIKGLVTYYILFFIDIASRTVRIAGITPHPDNRWMNQIARNVIGAEDGFLRGKRYLILDRDAKYSEEFRNALVREGIHLIRLPPRSPNLIAFAERFVRSIKSECLNRMIFFGRTSLQYAICHFMVLDRTRRWLSSCSAPEIADTTAACSARLA